VPGKPGKTEVCSAFISLSFSLLQTLQSGKPCLVKQRTVGTETSSLTIDRLCSFSDLAQGLLRNTPQSLHVVDFAGQEDYLSTHHLFLTAQAFCLLVVDMERYTAGRFRPDVEVWLETLETRLGGATVLLVSESRLVKNRLTCSNKGCMYPCKCP